MDPRAHWRAVYATKSPEQLSWYQEAAQPSLEALDRVGALPGMSLVDVGAGASTLADALFDRGWTDVTLVDISEPALEAARKRLGAMAAKIRWEIADLRHWQPGRSFDIWHDRAVFHFMTDAADRAAYRRLLTGATQPGSHVILATFALDGPEHCSGLPVSRYDAALLAAELGANFELVDDWRQTHATPWGAEQRFQWCLFTRR